MKPDADTTHFLEKLDRINYSSIGSLGQFKIVSILNLLQDAASEHAAQMGVSGFDLAPRNLAWVIARYQLTITNNPQWHEEIRLRTWRAPWKHLYEIRKFFITGLDNRPIIEAKAAWVMVKRETGRPVRLNRFMPDADWEKHASPMNDSTRLFSTLIKARRTDFSLPFKIRMHDLDLNGHVNNAVYVEWAVETVPESILSRFSPETIQVSFHKESLYGDTIVSFTEITEHPNHPETYHSITRKDTSEELARVNIRWKPLNTNGLRHDH